MNKMINIVLLDDESLFLEALAGLVNSLEEFHVAFKTNNGHDLISYLEHIDTLPDILLLDLNMSPINGLEVLEILHNKSINIKVIVLSSMYNSSMYGYMIKFGISGFLPKYIEKDELFHAINQVYTNKYYLTDSNQQLLNEHLANKKGNQNPWSMIALTDREIEVLICICNEMSTKEIAEKLFISIKTVESHRSKLMEKIGCKNVIGMVIYAILNGIYTLSSKKEKLHKVP